MESRVELLKLSQELLCHILSFLPISNIFSAGMTCKRLQMSVKIYLQLCTKLDLCDTEIWGSMSLLITDDVLRQILMKCPKLEILHGLCPQKIENRRLRGKAALSVPGVIDALLLCPRLSKVQTNCFDIFEAILLYLPHVEIDGCFRNYRTELLHLDGTKKHLKLPQFPLITSLNLTSISMQEIGHIPLLEHLQLQWVRFTCFNPFQSFQAPKLKTFVMKNCFGCAADLGYARLFEILSHCGELKRLECIKLPIPEGTIRRAVEQSWNVKGFQKLQKLILYSVNTILPSDIGYLMVAASNSLETVILPPEIATTNFFTSLRFSKCEFPKLTNLAIAHLEILRLHTFIAQSHAPAVEGGETLSSRGLTPSPITDRGMKLICRIFQNVETLSLSHAPHLNSFENWVARHNSWKYLRHLNICHCYCLNTVSLYGFIKQLEQLEVLIVKEMFPRKPRGCSHVGLSAGTGLGLKSVVVQGQDNLAILEEPFGNGLDHDANFFNLQNVNNSVECVQHGNHFSNSDQKIKLENESISSNEAICGSDYEDLEDSDLLNTPSTSSGITGRGKRPLGKRLYKGPWTRRLSRLFPKRFHQSTQTCFSSLQHSALQHQFCCSTCQINCRCYRANNTYRCKDYPQQKQGDVGVPKYVDAKTSTSDPMYGDEGHFTSMNIVSKTLKSLTVMSCGINSIHLNCPALKHIEVQACSILFEVMFERASPVLNRVNISSCPKFSIGSFLFDLPKISNSETTLLYFEPRIRVEGYPVLQNRINKEFPSIASCSFAVLYDYSSDKSNRGHYREIFLDWLRFTEDLMKTLNLYRESDDFPKKSDLEIHRICGKFLDGSRYELATNNLILATIWRQQEDSVEICPTAKYERGAYLELVASLQEIAAILQQRHLVCNVSSGCYIRLADAT